MKWGKGAIVACVVAAVAYAAAAFAALPVTIDDIKKVIPQAHSHIHTLAPVDHYLVADDTGATVGVAFVTSSVPPAVSAYVGEVDVLVGMDPNGAVTGVAILSHKESPDYIDMIVASGFLGKFSGRSVNRGFDDIETVTGATISSKAIKRDIQTSAFEITKKLIDSGELREEMGGALSAFDIVPIIAVVLLIGLTIAVYVMPKRRWLRYVLWGGSAVVIGFWLNSPLTIGIFVDLRNGVVPAHLPLLMLFVFAVIAPLVRCNLYCAYLCPFGALQESAGRLRAPKCKPTDRAVRNASWLRWIVLLATIFAIATGLDAFRTIEPFALCFRRSLAAAVWIQAGAVLIVALFVKRVWCRFFCPTGAVLDLINRLGRRVRDMIGRRGAHHDQC